MRIVITGTGTSQGIPVIGCHCEVCESNNPKDKRLRTAAFLEHRGTNLAIDAGPDFRQQMLRLGINRLDALILTHEHNDHVAGLDDIRPFNFIQKEPLKVFALPRVARDIQQRFQYIFSDQGYPGAPQVRLVHVEPYQVLMFGEMKILPFIVQHGNLEVLGFRCGSLVYITDANAIPPESSAIVKGADSLVINALHHRKHHSHFNLEQALMQAQMHKVKQVYFTHISHRMGLHDTIDKQLPNGANLAYDQLSLSCG